MKFSLFLLLFITVVSNSADIPSSFSKAKKIALTQVYKDHNKSFYCGCSFNNKKCSGIVNLATH